VRTHHPDDFALLRYTAGDLDESEHGNIVRHLDQCDTCLMTLAEIRPLDAALRRIGAARASAKDIDAEVEFAPDDPFRERPARSAAAAPVTRELVESALSHAERADAEVAGLLAALAESPEATSTYLSRLSFADPAARYLVLYALEEAVSRITVDGPARYLRFAEEVLGRLERESADAGQAEAMVRLGAITAQAHVLAGQACNWTGELEKARGHLQEAYRTFAGAGEADEIRLALTEYHESQRRSFAGRSAEGVALARRARATFETFGLEDYVARARVAEGIALSALDRDAEALVCYRAAVPVFERQSLLRNYVSAVNGLGASLARLGRLDEARREYSRALRRLSREQHPTLLAFTRNGLAHVLFFSRGYADAAKSFLQAARLFDQLDLVGDALTASLWEIESWARSGDMARARHRLQLFRTVVGRLGTLDPFIVGQLEQSLSGRDPDFERLGQIRRQAQETIREKLRVEAG
jgi:tetratricopeptide (TPR) repeat protein